jgi:hypothetical protein
VTPVHWPPPVIKSVPTWRQPRSSEPRPGIVILEKISKSPGARQRVASRSN